MRIYTSHRIKKRNGDNRKRINDYPCKDEPNKHRTSTPTSVIPENENIKRLIGAIASYKQIKE